MMFLARARLNRRRREAVRLLTDPRRMHAAVQSSFGLDDPGRVLWRVDQGRHHDTLYVVAPNRPDLTHLVDVAGWPEAHPQEVRDYQPLLDRLAPGMAVGYRLAANPTYRSTKDGRRVGHVTVAQQTGWAERKLSAAGLDLDVCQVTDRDVARFRRGENGRQVTLARASFVGTATVSDPDTLRTALVEGVGPAKAYGCGLLTLA